MSISGSVKESYNALGRAWHRASDRDLTDLCERIANIQRVLQTDAGPEDRKRAASLIAELFADPDVSRYRSVRYDVRAALLALIV